MRLLAKELRVSVITTKRAYEELEREGFITSQTGKGSFVAGKNAELVREARFPFRLLIIIFMMCTSCYIVYIHYIQYAQSVKKKVSELFSYHNKREATSDSFICSYTNKK